MFLFIFILKKLNSGKQEHRAMSSGAQHWIMVAPSHLYLAVCPISVMCNTHCEHSGLLGFEVQKLRLQSCAWEWKGNQKATEVWCHMTE